MSTLKQQEANRLNSQKCTGPRTPEGKAASRYNALKHGVHAKVEVMYDEDPGDLAGLAAEFHEQFLPANPNERSLVDALVNHEWHLRRLRRVEASLWIYHATTFTLAGCEDDDDESGWRSAGEAYTQAHAIFDRLQRAVNSYERNYHRSLKELKQLQAARQQALPPANPAIPSETSSEAPAPAPQPQPSTPGSAQLVSFRQNPSTSPVHPVSAPTRGPADPLIGGWRPGQPFSVDESIKVAGAFADRLYGTHA